ncbi:MAG: hypothetical protein H5U16_05295 [Roseovarius sp.]|nr:hypothetical protein [Roseovarius sp.]
MDLISRLDHQRGLSLTARECLRALEGEFAVQGFDMTIRKRGHFGDVLRWSRDGKPWFDALPAQHWVLFYLHKVASRAHGLDYSTICGQLPHAVERRDLVVKVRLHDRGQALVMAALSNDAVAGSRRRAPVRYS